MRQKSLAHLLLYPLSTRFEEQKSTEEEIMMMFPEISLAYAWVMQKDAIDKLRAEKAQAQMPKAQAQVQRPRRSILRRAKLELAHS
jgi:hypothetical protein